MLAQFLEHLLNAGEITGVAALVAIEHQTYGVAQRAPHDRPTLKTSPPFMMMRWRFPIRVSGESIGGWSSTGGRVGLVMAL